MTMPLRQSLRVASYLLRQKVTGRDKFPLIVELEPLFACNLKCAGCGKIQHPASLLKQRMPVEQAIASHPPADSEILDGEGGQKYLIEKRAQVSGADLVDAQASFDQQNGLPIVTFRFNTGRGRKLAELTKQNVGKRFAIVLDNKVISAPVIQSPIPGGAGMISGNFTVQSANDLAILLRAGALPARIDYRMPEFFIARTRRRLGIGRTAVQLILSRFAGRWEITEYLRNAEAVNFWRRVVGAYTRGAYQERIINGEVHQVFDSARPRPA